MTMVRTLTIGIPVLDRPQRVDPLVASIREHCPIDTLVVFICSPGDDAEVAAVRSAGLRPMIVDWAAGRGDYARKHNAAFLLSSTTWYFIGADDLRFTTGWFDRCLEQHRRTRACVIGTNDIGNSRVMRGQHSTHTLVHRDYLECGTIDQDGVILHEGYHHQFVDDEFIQTARHRGTFTAARNAIVEHLHPDWGKGVRDATYEKGRSTVWQDKTIYEERKHLWGA